MGGKLALCLPATGRPCSASVLGRSEYGPLRPVLSPTKWPLCTVRTHTHQQGNGHLVGMNPRLRTRSPASCARSCRSSEECVKEARDPGTPTPLPDQKWVESQRKGLAVSSLQRGVPIWCPPAELGGSASPFPLTAWPPTEGCTQQGPSRAGPSPLRVGVRQEPAGSLLRCVSGFTLHMPVPGHASMEDTRNRNLFTKY